MLKICILFSLFSFNLSAKTMPDFKLGVFGKKGVFKLSDALKTHDKVLLNFWASWCTGCIEELPDLEKLKKTYQGKVLFVGINADESHKKIKKFLAKHKFSYLILRDIGLVVSGKYEVQDLPKTIILNKKREVIFRGNRPPKAIP